jgi:hypothetical protein
MDNKLVAVIAAIGGGVIGFLFGSSKKDEKSGGKFYVFVDTKDFDKHNLEYGDFETAEKDYEKYVKAKEISYKDIYERNEDEYNLYKELEKKGGKDLPKMNDKSKITIITLLNNTGEELKNKEF